MTAIARASDGSIKVSFDNGKTITADHVILCMSFAVLRTLNYKKAGFDTLKQTAITQLGAGRNAKLNLQFDSRLWNALRQHRLALLRPALPERLGRHARRRPARPASSSSTPAPSVAESMGQSNPYTTTATNSQVTTYAQQFLSQLEPIFPGITDAVERQGDALHPVHRPELPLLLLVLEARPVHRLQRLRKRAPGEHPLRRRALLDNFQGFMEGGASEGVRAANEILADLKKL